MTPSEVHWLVDVLPRWQMLFLAIVTASAGGAGWVLRQWLREVVAAKADLVDVVDLRRSQDGLMTRMAHVENTLHHMPTAKQVHDLTLSIAEMRGDVRAVRSLVDGVDGRLDDIGTRVENIDGYLRQAKP